MNVRGRWQKKLTTWRKISLNTWSTPDNPTIYGLLDVDVGDLKEYLARRSEETGAKCTITHAVTRSLALLLRRHPDTNVLVRRRKIWLRDQVDIFHQVAMPLENGSEDQADLSGATIRRADTKSVLKGSPETVQLGIFSLRVPRVSRDDAVRIFSGQFRKLFRNVAVTAIEGMIHPHFTHLINDEGRL